MNKIRELRKEKGLTLKELSNELSTKENFTIAPDTLGKYERGEREPKLITWQSLANYFGVSVPYLQGISEYGKLTDYPSTIFGNDLSYSKEIQDELKRLYDEEGKKDDTLEINDVYKYMIGILLGNTGEIVLHYLLLRHDEWSDSYKEKQLETVVAIYEFIEKLKQYFYSINYTKSLNGKDKEKQADMFLNKIIDFCNEFKNPENSPLLEDQKHLETLKEIERLKKELSEKHDKKWGLIYRIFQINLLDQWFTQAILGSSAFIVLLIFEKHGKYRMLKTLRLV